MKKKDYQKPTMEVVQLQHQSHLLAGSGEQKFQMNDLDDYEYGGDPFNS